MESAKEMGETKAKSIFELDSDEESQNNEGDSGLAVSFELEASPSHTNNQDVSQKAVSLSGKIRIAMVCLSRFIIPST